MTHDFAEPAPELIHETLPAGQARTAVFRRTYDASIEDVWDACTDPERLARWYVPVTGDLRLGGTISQAMMGSGVITECEAPQRLVLSLEGGVDQITLELESRPDGQTNLVLQHATTLDTHEIQGETYDAIFCMGGGYYPRLLALDSYLRGTLPADYDTLTFFQREDMRPAIERGSAAMAELLESAAG